VTAKLSAAVDAVPTGNWYVTPHRCDCRTCPECSKQLGFRLRRNIIRKQKAEDFFKCPVLLTLTVDRKNFRRAPQAHRHITAERHVARLMRRLGIERWFWILEFQGKTGEGWPHWHVLIDLDGQDLGLLRQRSWRIWRDEWRVGGIDLPHPDKFGDAVHAINYATKYVMKQPDGGYPLWVLNSRRRIRFVGGCRKLGPLVSERPAAETPDQTNEDVDDNGTAGCRPLIDRMAGCGEFSRLWCEVSDPATGEVKLSYKCLLPLPADDVLAAAKVDGSFTAKITDHFNRTSRLIRPRRPGYVGLDPEAAGLDLLGLPQRLERRRRKLLADNKFLRRKAMVRESA
jgi:hypothetical protein